MVKKLHQFFDLLERLLNWTLVLKSYNNRDSNEEAEMLVAIKF